MSSRGHCSPSGETEVGLEKKLLNLRRFELGGRGGAEEGCESRAISWLPAQSTNQPASFLPEWGGAAKRA